ncbi:tRNA pseudouridine(55) synthase TruB [Alkalibaculum sp. M08DMB]|uniref:tRNA pseudouridine synthase B n=1 Tax=Alkalibaculum sporogenes TaxID=2655001 RepID=A0A6A7K8Q9_9FIRM|nr:tRNA pseudouridine(55) synthase TruB [Alkalibaculum sporogenes]MPW25830.1 tRNA pseudouridine(55) synthase TruB [Alkalibaculum sporogenes]
MNGILNIYKPSGMTSHDVVNKVRRALNTKKVGHTGTLDPIAEGILPLCIGSATKVSQFIVEKDKEYIAEVFLGVKTDSYDKTGHIVAENDLVVTKNQFNKILDLFIGDIEQVPPIYSAIKVKGKKLYEYARSNKPVEIKPRKVTIYSIDLLEYKYPIAKIKVSCAKGTYIRSLCNDIGEKLGTYGHMTSLIRTKSGPFHMENCILLDNLTTLDLNEVQEYLHPTDFPLQHLGRVDIQINSARFLLNGVSLIQKNIVQNISDFELGENLRLYLDNSFKGIGVIDNNDFYCIKPLRLFI